MGDIAKDLVSLIAIFAIAYCAGYLLTRHETKIQQLNRYDCNLALSSGQVPEDIKRSCIEQRINQINNTAKE